MPLVLGSAVLAWTLGDLVLTWEGWGGADVGTPSFADPFYVAFYPLAYAAIVLMLRREIKRMLPATWLDGAIAGLGAAAVCAAFVFPAVLKVARRRRDAIGVAVNLIYPIGDVLLLALVVGGTAVLPGRRLPWLLFATACAINGIGDTFNLFGDAAPGRRRLQRVAWPTAITPDLLSVWVPPGRRELLEQQPPGFALPGAALAPAW